MRNDNNKIECTENKESSGYVQWIAAKIANFSLWGNPTREEKLNQRLTQEMHKLEEVLLQSQQLTQELEAEIVCEREIFETKKNEYLDLYTKQKTNATRVPLTQPDSAIKPEGSDRMSSTYKNESSVTQALVIASDHSNSSSLKLSLFSKKDERAENRSKECDILMLEIMDSNVENGEALSMLVQEQQNLLMAQEEQIVSGVSLLRI